MHMMVIAQQPNLRKILVRASMRLLLLLLPTLLTMIGLSTSAKADDPIIGRASVIDGDTIEIRDLRFRLHGVDAPETSQPCFDENGAQWRCGQAAALALSDYISVSPVSCVPITTDRYGRTVARCSVRGSDIEEWLVRNGWAFAYRKYSTDYIAAEADARSRRVNIWRGTTQPPWDYRHYKRSPTGVPSEKTF